MKRIILALILFFNLIPCIKHGEIKLTGEIQIMAQPELPGANENSVKEDKFDWDCGVGDATPTSNGCTYKEVCILTNVTKNEPVGKATYTMSYQDGKIAVLEVYAENLNDIPSSPKKNVDPPCTSSKPPVEKPVEEPPITPPIVKPIVEVPEDPPADPPLTPTIGAGGGTGTPTMVTCPDISITSSIAPSSVTATDGSITVSISGGSGDYSFAINTGTLPSGNVFENLGIGSYTVTVTDNQNSCQVSTASKELSVPIPKKEDCMGVKGGFAHLDKCNSCVGGTSPIQQDCNKTPCEQASEQLQKQNLLERIKELNNKAKLRANEWGQSIRESFQNSGDMSTNTSGTISSVDPLTEGTVGVKNGAGNTVYYYSPPTYGLGDDPGNTMNNPRTIGVMHCHPFDNSCFSADDLYFFKAACDQISDPTKKSNYFHDVIAVMVDPSFAYSLKITDATKFCDLIGSKTLADWNTEFLNYTLTKASTGSDIQGQSVAFLQLFGGVVSIQQAQFDLNGNLSGFDHLVTQGDYYTDTHGMLVPFLSLKNKKCDDYRK